MGEVISLERRVRRRRRTERSRLHVACAAIIDASVLHAREAARAGARRDRPVWVARARKLEALATWAASAE